MRIIITIFVLVLLASLTWLLLPLGGSPKGASAHDLAPHDFTTESAELIDIEGNASTLLEGGETTERAVVATKNPEPLVDGEPIALGLVLDAATRKPVQGAEINLSRPLHKEFNTLDMAHYQDSVPVASTVSDSEGRFRMRAPADVPLDLAVQSKGYATAHRAYVFADDSITVLLQPGAILEGRITKESTDEPLAGVKLQAWNGARSHILRGETDIGGNFKFEGLGAEVITFVVTPNRFAAPSWESIELIAGQTIRIDLALAEGVSAFGVVTDKQSGLPIEGAEVSEGWTFQRTAVTDAEGRYRLSGLGKNGVYNVHARAAGHSKAQCNNGPIIHDAPAVDKEVNFALELANGATGRVVDAEGNAIPSVYCAAVGNKRIGGKQHADYVSCNSDEDGRFSIDGLNTELPHQISLRASGYGVRTYDFPSPESGVLDLGTFVLHKPGAVRGSVIDTEGQPLPAIEITLDGTNGDVSARRPQASRPYTTSYTSKRDSRTDSLGRFHFADVAGGSYKLRAALDRSSGVSAETTLQLAESEISTGTILVLETGGMLSGRALNSNNKPLIGAIVAAWPADSPRMNGVYTRSGANGTFHFHGLELGEYFLRIDVRYLNSKDPAKPMASAAPLRATTGDSGLTLYTLEPDTLRIQLLTTKGQPHPEGFIQVLEPGTDVVLDQGWSDAQGRFATPVRPGGQFDIKWSPSMRRTKSDDPVDDTPDITLRHASPGQQEHVLKHP